MCLIAVIARVVFVFFVLFGFVCVKSKLPALVSFHGFLIFCKKVRFFCLDVFFTFLILGIQNASF